jgi:ubiquinone/menaquinone biosynthesis C-methylase UbiE
MISRRRKQRVIAQYDSAEAAQDHAQGYARSRIDGRLLQSRHDLVLSLLADGPGGRLLDAGCGPGVLAHSLLRSPRHDLDVTVLDQSLAMVRHCLANSPSPGRLHPCVGDLCALPFADGSFDVTIVTGALEYTNPSRAVAELSRVTRPGGTLIASMLNPLSPYRLAQWLLFWPALRALSVVEKALGRPAERRHGARVTGIRTLAPSKFRALMRKAGLSMTEVRYLTPTVLIPPLDRFPAVTRAADRVTSALTQLGFSPLLATGYLVIARRG